MCTQQARLEAVSSNPPQQSSSPQHSKAVHTSSQGATCLPAQVDSPGTADAQRFYLHPSVFYWTDMATNFASWYSPQKGVK